MIATSYEDALLVGDPSLRIEDAGDGSGSQIETMQLAIGSSVELFALSRWSDGVFYRAEEVSWSASGGSIDAQRRSAMVTATTAETISILAEGSVFGSAMATIQTAECFAPSDCSDPCRSSNDCVAGLCAVGAVDKDTDGDGFIDIACSGGNDCDDDPPACGAGCFPENGSDSLCDGADQDCDMAVDEGFVVSATSCGVGACAGNVGTLSCSLGVESDSCDPLAGALAWFADADGDTFGNAAVTQDACVQPVSIVLDSQDCADTPTSDPSCGGIDGSFCNPSVTEGPSGDATCFDGVDNDCDGQTDAADSGCAAPAFVVSNVDPTSFTPEGRIDQTGCTSPVTFNSTTLAYSANWCGNQPTPIEVNAGGGRCGCTTDRRLHLAQWHHPSVVRRQADHRAFFW